jgi:hypothetical protein
MDANRLGDGVARGMGRAALVLGERCDAFRPVDAMAPLAPECRFLRLNAWFTPPRDNYRGTPGYGQALWLGVLDSTLVRPGDYLRRVDGAVWFVASCEKMQPVPCVRAERVVALRRQAGAALAGRNGYGGLNRAEQTLLAGWPASVLAAGGGARGSADLPDHLKLGAWQVLLPEIAGVVPENGDLLRDELGRSGVVISAELSALGWRLLVRQEAG